MSFTCLAASTECHCLCLVTDPYWHLASIQKSCQGCADTDLIEMQCKCVDAVLLACADVQNRVEKALGGALDSEMLMHEVRLVAPNKKMLCLSFRVPPAVAFATVPHPAHDANDLSSVSETSEQQSKRQRTLT